MTDWNSANFVLLSSLIITKTTINTNEYTSPASPHMFINEPYMEKHMYNYFGKSKTSTFLL